MEELKKVTVIMKKCTEDNINKLAAPFQEFSLT
jgi:hypothetical protein